MLYNLSILVEDKLNYESLKDLVSGSVLAVIVRNYYPQEYCDIFSAAFNELLKDKAISIGGGIYDTTAPSFWEAMQDHGKFDVYFAEAIKNMNSIRNVSPLKSPSDIFRLEIDELWPSGASILHLNNKSMFFGIIRSWKGGAKPHLDNILYEAPEFNELEGELSQIGMNIYLKVPNEGGEILMWDHSFSKVESDELGVKGSYGFDIHSLPPVSLSIRPQQGDLILLNSRKIHAVKECIDGERLTISGFVGYWGDDKPLRYWS